MSCGCQKTDDFCPDAPDTSTEAAEATTRHSLQRRTLLKAAAIGSTFAALTGREGFSPFSALAHTDSKSACTANDIAVSDGRITNEPCGESQSFQAIAEFTVTNNNNATRKCVTLHMGAGGLFGGKDFLLTDANGSSNISGNGTSKKMFASLGTVPANFSGECYPGSVVAFQTARNQSDDACDGPLQKYPGGQCKRQTICIVGFGVTLECATSGCGSTGSGNCSVPCGGTLYLKAVAAGASEGATANYTFTLTDKDGTVVGSAGPNAAATQCFSVANPVAGNYTVTVADSRGCTRTATVTVTVAAITAGLDGTARDDCTGRVDFTASTSGSGSCTYQFFVAGQSQGAASSTNTFTYDPRTVNGGNQVDGDDHSVRVHVVCGSCSADATETVNTCATTTVTTPA